MASVTAAEGWSRGRNVMGIVKIRTREAKLVKKKKKKKKKKMKGRGRRKCTCLALSMYAVCMNFIQIYVNMYFSLCYIQSSL